MYIGMCRSCYGLLCRSFPIYQTTFWIRVPMLARAGSLLVYAIPHLFIVFLVLPSCSSFSICKTGALTGNVFPINHRL